MSGEESIRTSLLAAAAAALFGLISFWIFHTIWIRNVPGVLFEGVFYALPAVPALAWALRITRRAGGLGHGLPGGAALGAGLWATLIPYEILGLVTGRWPVPTSLRDVLGMLWISLPAFPAGALLGWQLTRARAGALAWGVAALALDFALGGGITSFGGRGPVLGLFLWLLPTWLVAGTIVVGIMDARSRVPALDRARS